MNFQSTLRVRIDGSRAVAGANQVTQATGKLDKSASHLRRTLYDLRFALVSLGAIQAVRGVLRMNDAFMEQQTALRNVAQSEEEVARVRARLLSQSNALGQSIDSSITLYTRLTRATDAMNLSEAERLRLTDLINKASIISGATTAEAAGAIRQLTQAFARGQLRGEEFNSVAEQMPIILDAVRAATGATRAELLEMAAAGELTPKLIVAALKEFGSEIDRQAANVRLTFGRAMQTMRNNLQQAAGESDVLQASLRGLAGAVKLVSENLDALLKIIMVLTATQLPRLVAYLGTVARAFAGVGSAVGAIPGLMSGLVAGVVALGLHMDRLRDQTDEAQVEFEQFFETLNEGQQVLAAQSRLRNLALEMEEVNEQLAEAERIRNLRRQAGGSFSQSGAVEFVSDNDVENLRLRLEALQESYRKVAAQLADTVEAQQDLAIANREVTADMPALTSLIDDLNNSLQDTEDGAEILAIEVAEVAKVAQGSFGGMAGAAMMMGEEIQRVSRVAGHMFEETGETASEVIHEMKREAPELSNVWVEALRDIDRAFIDVWRGAFDSFSSFADRLKNAFMELIAQMAHQAISRPILIPLMAGLGGPGAASAMPMGGGGGGGFLGSILGAGNLVGGGTGFLGNLLFGAPQIASFGSAGGVPLLASMGTTGGLLSGFSGFMTGGLSGGLSTLGSALSGGMGLLSGLGAFGGIGLALAGIASLAGAFDDPGKTTPRIRLATNQVGRDSQYWSPFSRETALGVTVQGQRITEAFSPDGQAAQDVLDQVVQFDEAIALAINQAAPELQDRIFEQVKAALLGPGGESFTEYQDDISVEQILSDRFGVVLAAMDPAIQRFVNDIGGDLEEQISSLATGLNLDRIVRESGLFDDLQDAFDQIGEFQREGETFDVTVNRVVGSMEVITAAFEMMGRNVDELGERFIEVSAEFAEAAGSVENAQSLWASYFENYLSDAERAAAQQRILGDAASSALGAIGLTGGVDAYTMEGLRALFEEALPGLSGADLALWLQALEAFAAYIDAIPDQVQAAVDAVAIEGVTLNVDSSAIQQQIIETEANIRQSAQQAVAQLFGSQVDRLNAEIQRMGDNPQLSRLVAQMVEERDALVEQQRRAQELASAQGLLQNIADLSGITGQGFADVADSLGFDLGMLAQVLGTDLPGLTEMLRVAQEDSITLTNLTELINGAATSIADAFNGVFNEDSPFLVRFDAASKRLEAAAFKIDSAAEKSLSASDNIASKAENDPAERRGGSTMALLVSNRRAVTG